MAAKRKLNIMVACDRNRGIGYQNRLPWPTLRTDLDTMVAITKTTTDSGKQNAVILGRRTWESVPDKFKPLKGRFNVVLTSRPSQDFPRAHLICPSLADALSQLEAPPLSESIEDIYIMGGSQVYEEVLAHPRCGLVYCTEIMAEFPCDSFMPPLDPTRFTRIDCDRVPQGIITENNISYQFTVYKPTDE